MANDARADSERARGRAQLSRIVGSKMTEPVPLGHADEEINGADLLALELPEMHYLCRPWIPEGVLLLAGPPKLGKTSAVRQAASAIARAGSLWGSPCKAGEVLFLSLEEGAKLMRLKLKRAGYGPDDVRRIRFHWKWRPGVFGVGDIREKLVSHPEIKLVVIDSLTRFREASTRDKPQFQQDYEAVAMLAELAKDRPGLSIVVIHHTKKNSSPDDPIADISGTYGLTAAADSYMVLRREGGEFVLHCGGRYWDEPQDAYRLRRDNGRWVLEGAAEGVKLSSKQRQYLEALRAEGTITTRGMARRFNVRDSTASEILAELQEKGLAERTPDGWRPVSTTTTHTETTERHEWSESTESAESTEGWVRSFGGLGSSGNTVHGGGRQ